MRARLYIIVLLLMLSVTMAAQNVRIEGKVTDEGGQPMEMVNVRLQRESIGTMTNFKGEYVLHVPESDTLRVIFTSIGYKRVERVVNTKAGHDAGQIHAVRLDVQMHVNQAYIGDVEVTAQQQKVSTTEKLEAGDIQHMPSASGNAVEDMLGTMAGVTMNNELSSQYSVRGGSFDENLVYVNGIEIYRPQLIASGQQEGLSFINPSMVREVNFSTGGFSAEYGDKMSSVLDIEYKRPEEFEASASVSLMGASASLGQRTKRFSQLHGLRYRRNASMLSSLDTKGEYDPRFTDYQVLLGYEMGDKWDVQFLGNIAMNHYRFVPQTRETSFGTMEDVHKFKVYFDGHEKDEFDTFFGAATLSYKGLKGTVLSLMASAFATDEEVTYDISGEYWLDQATDGGQSGLGIGAYHEHARNYLDASVMALTLKGVSQVGHSKLSYGITLQRENIEDRIAEWERRDSSGYTLPHTGDMVQTIYNLHSFYSRSTTRTSVFVQDQMGWNAMGGRFVMIGGVRLSHWSFNGETLVSPRLSLRFTPEMFNNDARRLSLRLSSGIYYQSPFYKEYRLSYKDEHGNGMVHMNTDIRSQRSWQLVMGADYTFRAYDRPFKFTAETYYKGISNYIPYMVDNVQIRYNGANSGKAFNTGIDMKLFGEFVPGTDSWLSLSLMKAKETYDGLKTPRPTEQRYSIGVFFSDYWPGNDSYKVFLKGIMNDGLPFYAPMGGRESGVFRTPSYRRVDLGASRVWNDTNSKFMRRRGWRHIKEMSAGIDVFNLLDIDNTNSYYWVTAVDNMQYAVPNYLTGRMLSVSFSIQLK
ncbi:MAG: TonB-dependent receptor [Bacteroidales bacterium]|nr:TonB-dependent receptor [Candidatus Liminaster caballi]